MQFIKYRDFYEEETAAEFAQLLTSNNIPFQVEEVGDQFGSMYGQSPTKKAFTIKLKKEDFEKVDRILNQNATADLDSIDKDHYLFGFSNEELLEVLAKPDEWSALDFQLAKKILTERGVAMPEEEVVRLKSERLKELAKPEVSQKWWIYAGYFLALIGGLIGVFIGWHLYTYKKVLPNGDRVYGYIQSDRRHGLRIFIIGAILFLLSIAIRANNDYWFFFTDSFNLF